MIMIQLILNAPGIRKPIIQVIQYTHKVYRVGQRII